LQLIGVEKTNPKTWKNQNLIFGSFDQIEQIIPDLGFDSKEQIISEEASCF